MQRRGAGEKYGDDIRLEADRFWQFHFRAFNQKISMLFAGTNRRIASADSLIY
jgi:hypothetical protein